MSFRRLSSKLHSAGLRLWLAVRYALRNLVSARSLPITPGAPIVSLTSYSKRLWRVYLTIESLFDQAHPVGGVYLWLTKADAARLPPSLSRLARRGLTIVTVDEDLRSYKKLVYCTTVQGWSHVATADDDVFYPAHWLGGLMEAARRYPHSVICYRAQVLKRRPDGSPAPYAEFELAQATHGETGDLIPTGVSGVLYPRASLGPALSDATQFQVVCPDADDIWFRFCTAAAGYKVALAAASSTNFPSTNAPWSGGLWKDNVSTGNDASLRRAFDHFGDLLAR